MGTVFQLMGVCNCQVLHLSFSLMGNFAFASVHLLQLLY